MKDGKLKFVWNEIPKQKPGRKKKVVESWERIFLLHTSSSFSLHISLNRIKTHVVHEAAAFLKQI